MENAWIADRLDAFATLLELAEANPYQPRAYRRAAETIRAAPAPIAPLVRAGRVRQLRGIGPGIEVRLRELVETGEIAELRELERELAPGLVGLGRFLGLTTKRSVEIARALGVRTPEEFREAVAEGPAAVGPRRRAEARGARDRGARARAHDGRGCCSTGRERSSARSRPRSAASRRATCAGGATRASSSRWSARLPIRRRCSPASRRCRRSSR